jgi:hypothetical protein
MAAKSAFLRRLQPFTSSHWSLAVVLVVAWELMLLARQCDPSPYYRELALAVTTVCLAFWTNHVAFLKTPTGRPMVHIISGGVLDILKLFLWVILIAVPLTVIWPSPQCYTDRAMAAEVILGTASAKEAIETRALAQGKVDEAGRGVKFPIQGRIKFGMVTTDGKIIAGAEDPLYVVVLIPTMDQKEVRWTCSGFPSKISPASCRENLDLLQQVPAK